jgi:hypothetical protein
MSLSAWAGWTLGASDADGRWRLGLGDPTIWGWLVTLMYFGVVAMCVAAWRREDWAFLRGGRGMRPRFWLVVGAVMLVLGLNKQLDLQTLVTSVGRSLAKSQGWYEKRRLVQGVFVAVTGLVALGAVACGWWWLRSAWRRYWPAWVGLMYLGAFIVVRAASFHHLDDALFKTAVFERFVSRGLEAAGVALVGWGAWRIMKGAGQSSGRKE